MMPLPLILATVILLGWPLLKLVATLLSRPLWRRVKELSAQLKLDERYGDAERTLIDRTIRDAKGEPLQILMPIFVLAGGIAFAFAHPFGVFAKDDESESEDSQSESIEEIRRKLSEVESQAAQLGLKLALESTPQLPRSSPMWADKRFQLLGDLSLRLAWLRYPVASLLTGLAALIVSPLIFVAEGLRASAWAVVQRLVVSSAYSSRVFARSVGVIS
jgi:hypothetical protein